LIDVVIPVYRGLAETRACIESVLAARTREPREIVVIDDASPEPDLSEWLRTLARTGAITLIAHADNRGFLVTANEGMGLHPDRDVVLLNSDTEVADGWLDRLAAHARDLAVGTVTPFSDNATVCSYPRTLAPNAIPRGETTASLDAAFATANAGRSVEIPTAVGFCMFIARRCLERIGPFDEARYGTGYGEEVDFCMRASRAGFRNVLAADVFVHHVGEVSFGTGGAGRREKAQATVDALYPEFQERLREHLAKDPAKGLRRRADLERLRRSRKPRLLFVSHGYGGGLRRHLEELARSIAADCEVLLLQPYLKSFASLTWLARDEEFALWFHQQDDWEQLIATLRGVGISRVHYHHVHGLPPAVLDLARRLGCAHDVTLHDYLAVCPRYHLTDASGRYCGEPGANGCMRCLEAGPAPWGLTIEEWRARFRVLLGSAARVIAPSHDAARRIQRYYPEVKPVLWPHALDRPRSPRAAMRVLVLGGISPEKGIDVLDACARDAKARALPLHFRVVGFLARALPQWPELPITLTGEYRDETLAELIDLERGDAIFFPTQVPETFSYTLSTAMASALPIVATDLGSFPERLASHPAARIVPWRESSARMNDILLECARPPEPAAPLEAGGSTFDEYRARYLEGIRGQSAAPSDELPPVEQLKLSPPHEDLPRPTLWQLFDGGVRCGQSGATASLGHLLRTGAQHPANAEPQPVAARLEAAEARIRAFESATSWKLTAPLRALKRMLLRRS
jgi:GT2 family glycosyltransferase/glycosyltransferase involved in cell wall biosynthesis